MSWSFNVQNTPREGLGDTLYAAAEDYFGANPSIESRETREQVGAAIEAARALERSTFLGTTGNVNVYLAGHANPNHGQVGGYSNEHIGIQINERAIEAPEGAEGSS